TVTVSHSQPRIIGVFRKHARVHYYKSIINVLQFRCTELFVVANDLPFSKQDIALIPLAGIAKDCHKAVLAAALKGPDYRLVVTIQIGVAVENHKGIAQAWQSLS